MRPTGILPTSAYGASGAPSKTHTWSVLSDATNTRSFAYRRGSTVGCAAGDGVDAGIAAGAATSALVSASDDVGATDAPAHEASSTTPIARSARPLTNHSRRIAAPSRAQRKRIRTGKRTLCGPIRTGTERTV